MPTKAEREAELEQSEAQEVANQIRRVMEAAGDGSGTKGGTVQVWRKRIGRRAEYLEQLNLEDIEEDPLEAVKERHGGGSYRLAIRNASHQYVPGGSINFDIAGKSIVHEKPATEPHDEERDDERDDERERRMAARLEDARGRETPELVRFLMEELRELRTEMRRPPPEAFQANPAQMAVELMTAIQSSTAPLMAALLERREESKSSARELRDMLELMQIARETLGGNGGGGDGWSTIANQLARPLGTFFERAAAGELPANGSPGFRPNPGPGPSSSAPPPSTQTPADPAGGTENMPAWLQALRPSFASIMQWAQEERDPEVCADFLSHDIPDDLLGPLLEDLERPELVDEIAAGAPPVRPFVPWLRAFVARLAVVVRFNIEAPEEPDQDEERGSSSSSAAEVGGASSGG